MKQLLYKTLLTINAKHANEILMQLKSSLVIIAVFLGAISVFAATAQPTQVDANQNENLPITQSINEEIITQPSPQMESAQDLDNTQNPAPNNGATQWMPEADFNEQNPEYPEEPKLIQPKAKKPALSDFGQNDAELPFYNEEEAENQAVIESTIHRKREIDPKKRLDLMELSRVLGALHALRISCAGVGDQTYRAKMSTMLDMEAPSADYIRDPLTISFNNGFQSQGGGESACPADHDTREAQFARKGKEYALKMVLYYTPQTQPNVKK